MSLTLGPSDSYYLHVLGWQKLNWLAGGEEAREKTEQGSQGEKTEKKINYISEDVIFCGIYFHRKSMK